MKNILLDLLNFRSTSENTTELYKIVDYVDQYFNEFDVIKNRYEKNKKPSIVILTKNTKSPKIILNGHLDVVPAEDELFIPKESDGNIIGRGASDMKGVNVAMMVALSELLKEGQDLDVGLMLTTDEEIGGMNGVKYLLDEENYSCEIAFIPDSGLNWKICNTEKGVLHLEINAKGQSAHGSVPWLGDNAINKCWKFYRDVRNEFRDRWGKLRPEDSWKPTINLGSLHGGDAANKVPNSAQMLLDIRFPAPVTLDEIWEIVNKYKLVNDIEVVTKVASNANYTDPENKYIDLWSQILKESNIKNSRFHKANGGSDARHFGAKGIPFLMTMPNASNPHTDDEWIDISDLIKFKDVLKKWIIEAHK